MRRGKKRRWRSSIRRRLTRRGASSGVTPQPPRSRRTLVVVVAATVTVAALLLAFPLALSRVLGVSPLADKTVADRVLIYDAAIRVAAQHPLLGVGPSGFLDAVPRYLGAAWYREVGPNTTLDSPHSWILQAVEAGGIPLLVLALGFAVLLAVVGVSRWRRQLAAPASRASADLLAGSGLALVGFAVTLLSQFTSPGTTILAAFLVGVVAGRPTESAYGAQTQSANLIHFVGIGALAVWAVALAVFAYAEIPLQTGAVQAGHGQIAEADASFTTALALRPWDVDIASDAAQVLAHEATENVQGAAGLAETYASRALAQTPTSVQALKALAVAQQYSGQLRPAQRTLLRLKEIVPLDETVALRLGGVDVLLKSWASAKAQLELATMLAPNDPSPWLTLQYLYQQTGDSAAATTAGNRAQELSNSE